MKYKITLMWILIILLTLSNLYFINKFQEFDYEIMLGIPVNSEAGDTNGIDFTKSKPIGKSEGKKVILSLVTAISVQSPEIMTVSPDAVIWISDSEENITYVQTALWLKEDSVIFGLKKEDDFEYKKVNDDYYVTELKKIVGSQMSLYKK